jgi:hypothetical protein
MAGVPVDLPWCEERNPFTKDYYWAKVSNFGLQFFLHDCSLTVMLLGATRFTLTERNFETVLFTIIDQK